MKNKMIKLKRIKALGFTLYAATSLTHINANPNGSLDNYGTILVLDSTVSIGASKRLDLLGSGRFIFTQNNSTTITDSSATIATTAGALEATDNNAFGSAALTFADATTFYSGSAQAYGSGNPVDYSNTPLTIANPIQLVTDSGTCGLTFNTEGLVVNSSEAYLEEIPSIPKYRPFVLSGGLSKTSASNAGTVTFTSTSTYPITLSGASNTGHKINNVVVSENSQLILNNANALPSSLTQLTLYNDSVLQDSVSTSINADVLVEGSEATITTDISQILTLNGALKASDESNVFNKLGHGTLVLAGTNCGDNVTHPALSINSGIVKIDSMSNLPASTTLNTGGTLAITQSITLSADDFTPHGGSLDAIGNTITFGQALPNVQQNLHLYHGTFDLNSKNNSTSSISLMADFCTIKMHTSTDTPPNVQLNNSAIVADFDVTPSQTTFTIIGYGLFSVNSGAIFTLMNDIGGDYGVKFIKRGRGTLVLAETNTTNNVSLEIGTGIVQFSQLYNIFGYQAEKPVIFSGGILQYTGSGPITIANPLTLTSNTTNATFDNATSYTVTLSGAISGGIKPLNLTSSGGGQIIVSGGNTSGGGSYSDNQTYTNSTRSLSGGTLEITESTSMAINDVTSDSTLVIDDDVTLMANQAIPSSAYTLYILGQNGDASGQNEGATGSGIFKFNGANNSSSTTNLHFGNGNIGPTFQVGSANDFPNATVTLDGATLDILGDSTLSPTLAITNSPTINVNQGTTVTLNASISGSGDFYKTGRGPLIFNSLASNDNQYLHLVGTAQIANSSYLPGNPNQNTLYFDGGTLIVTGTTTINQPFSSSTGLPSFLQMTDDQTVTLASTATFSTTKFTLEVSNATSSPTNGSTLDLRNVGSNATANTTLQIDSNITVKTNNTNQLPGGTNAGVILNGGGTWTHSTNAISYEAPVTISGINNTIKTDAAVTLSNNSLKGAGSLTKTGTQSLILTDSGDYEGALTVSEGTLELQNAGALANDASLSVGTATVAFSATGSFVNNITSTDESAALNVNADATYSGVLSGTGFTINANDDQTLILANTDQSSYTCPLQLNQGTFTIGTGTLPNSVITLVAGTTLKSTAGGVRLSTGSLVIAAS